MAATIHDEILKRFRMASGPTKLRDRPETYTVNPEDNLVAGLPAEILQDFTAGSGGELEGDLPKFCAVHSSSALAANSFGPMRLEPSSFSLGGVSGFEDARFEHQLPTGLLGTPPNLDFVAWGPGGTVAVESKFTEVLSPKVAKFAASYSGAVERLADSAWEAMFESLREEPRRFRHLDAAQLVKHYLGMRNTLRDATGEVALIYAFWEPANAAAVPVFEAHRAEVAEFAAAVSESTIRFIPISHSELWSEWEASSTWRPLAEHLGVLRTRYEWALPPQAT